MFAAVATSLQDCSKFDFYISPSRADRSLGVKMRKMRKRNDNRVLNGDSRELQHVFIQNDWDRRHLNNSKLITLTAYEEHRAQKYEPELCEWAVHIKKASADWPHPMHPDFHKTLDKLIGGKPDPVMSAFDAYFEERIQALMSGRATELKRTYVESRMDRWRAKVEAETPTEQLEREVMNDLITNIRRRKQKKTK